MSPTVTLSLRNLGSNKIRFLLTTFSVLAGVAFVVASFVLSDGLRSTFNTIVEDANANVDASVRAEVEFDEVQFGVSSFDEDVVDLVRTVEGVDEAEPWLNSAKIIPVNGQGEPIETFGPPVLSVNWVDSPISPMHLVTGETPDGPGEFAIDVDAAENEEFVVGETYEIIGVEGREPFELVGLTRFGEDNTLGGAVVVSFTMDELQRLDGNEGKIHGIDVSATEGTDPEELVANLQEALPVGLEAVGADVVVDEAQDDFQFIIDIFGTILLVFAFVVVFVSAFIIFNTFNILLGQRIRQLALLRALGASTSQVRTSALLEALIIGLLASIAGIVGGVLLALLLRAVMNGVGMNLPGLEIILSVRTIIWAVLVGVGITLAAAMVPAMRAGRVPPVAAMQEGYRFGSGLGKRRTIIAIVLGVPGVTALVFSLFGDVGDTSLRLSLLGAGVVVSFISLTMFMPLFSSPSARFLGAPLERLPWLGVTGKMARENSARDNKQTARTAAGLVIGLALVAMATVVATSLKDSFRSSLGSTLISDYLVTSQNDTGFTQELAADVAALPEFVDVTAVRYGTIRVNGSERQVAATDLTLLTSGLDVGVLSGDPAADAGPGVVAITQDAADDEGLAVGDHVAIEFATTGFREFEVNAIYDNDFLIGHWIIDLSAWDENFTLNEDSVIAASVAPGVDSEAAEAALEPLEESYPQLQFETREQFRERLEGQLDNLLVIINVFLLLAIIIALMGITNTMALSILERTREIGLMRAVGMTRRQTRTMIRWEAGVVSLFGAILGVIVGIVFGWIAVTAIPDSIVSSLSIPGITLVVYVFIATLAGLFAASIPARRASRLEILDAIHEL
jgi:putative ABC transport system permease protein